MSVDNVPVRVGDDVGTCPIYDCDERVVTVRCDKVVSSLGGRLFAVWAGQCLAGHACSIAVQIREIGDAAPSPLAESPRDERPQRDAPR